MLLSLNCEMPRSKGLTSAENRVARGASLSMSRPGLQLRSCRPLARESSTLCQTLLRLDERASDTRCPGRGRGPDAGWTMWDNRPVPERPSAAAYPAEAARSAIIASARTIAVTESPWFAKPGPRERDGPLGRFFLDLVLRYTTSWYLDVG